MVRREADGSTLYYIDSDGVKQEFTTMEPDYAVVVLTQGRQMDATRQNRSTKDHYMNWLTTTAQVNEDASRPYPPYMPPNDAEGKPVPLDNCGKPKMWVVLDPTMDETGSIAQGAESWVSWIPELPSVHKKTK